MEERKEDCGGGLPSELRASRRGEREGMMSVVRGIIAIGRGVRRCGCTPMGAEAERKLWIDEMNSPSQPQRLMG